MYNIRESEFIIVIKTALYMSNFFENVSKKTFENVSEYKVDNK